MGEQNKTLVVVLGATATGKTDLSIEIAERFSAPVLSCDSRQFYREIPIGTAAPTPEQQARVPHYFIATRSVTDFYSCGRYEEEALELLDRLFVSHDVVVMVGGSGLYIDAVCNGIDDIPATNEVLRSELQRRLEVEGLDNLLGELERRDPEYYEQVDRCNHKRVIRALEVCIETGGTYTELRKGEGKQRPFRIVKVGVTMPRDELYRRINLRVDLMLQEGLEEEARRMFPLREHNALQTVGYKEMFDYFEGTTTFDEAVELIKRNSRRYAKRQITWFGRDKNIAWFGRDDADQIVKFIQSE